MLGYLVRMAAVIAVLGLPAAAQDRQTEQNFRSWFAYVGDHPFGDSRWGVHLEGQIRREGGVSKWQQYLLRPALNYQANRLLMLSAGYVYVRSYPRNPFGPRNEQRIWEQARLSYRTGGVAWNSRYRFENRFIEGASGQHRFENRIRALQQATVPLSTRIYVTGYDENLGLGEAVPSRILIRPEPRLRRSRLQFKARLAIRNGLHEPGAATAFRTRVGS